MHNDRMSLPVFRGAAPRRARRSLIGLALTSALVLTACSGGEEDPADPAAGSDAPGSASGSGSTSASAEEPYLPVPDGVELTAQGSELALGDKATVAYEPRQDEVAALDLTVTAIEKASFKLFVGWKLEPDTLKTTPYFIRAKVKNIGETDLGGREVPLYAVDGENRLIKASTFKSTFKPCPSELLPKKFATGDSVKTCLVYLAPDKGEVVAAEFRPTEEFDQILWTGEITVPEGLQSDKGEKGKKGKAKKGNKNG